MGGIEIVEATSRHVDALTDLVHASRAYQGGYASILVGYRMKPSYLDDHPTGIAMVDGEIAGFYSLIPRPAELDLLFVADSAQGLGIGAALVAHMLDRAAVLGATTVRVVSHPPAVGFYQRVGARQIGTVAPIPPKITWSRPELVIDVP
ncbi:GNAT family N-acetyltransferase [Kutzneria sp. CA-103260]|uniref:GNAT family N-acetyltransferase n=1 Tax=Kutzneria sp. CA-103260 TaxID=2802641 RepID=UPI001BA91FD1|nr:GNAT family N-acetyltransferase [Kutzneria sp. CA-103260]QUQ64826.1 acetyltransferase [Kutzneria sp. CA-103260]